MASKRHRPRIRSRDTASKRGLPPGTLVYTGEPRTVGVAVRRVHYTPDALEEIDAAEVAELFPVPETGVTWIDVRGLHDVETLQALAEPLSLHPLALEDAVNVSSGPKVEAFEAHLFVITKALLPTDGNGLAVTEQIAIAVGPTWLLSLQERSTDTLEPVLRRIRMGRPRIRSSGPDYLLHAILDSVVDGWFALLQKIEERVNALEVRTLERDVEDLPGEVHGMKVELMALRSALRPMDDVMGELLRLEGTWVRKATVPFMRDLRDHVRQAGSILDEARDRLTQVLELHLALNSERMNEVMKLLTLVSTVFIPMTFIAGVYGMNFANMPELNKPWAYPLALLVMASIGVGMGIWFHRRRWV